MRSTSDWSSQGGKLPRCVLPRTCCATAVTRAPRQAPVQNHPKKGHSWRRRSRKAAQTSSVAARLPAGKPPRAGKNETCPGQSPAASARRLPSLSAGALARGPRCAPNSGRCTARKAVRLSACPPSAAVKSLRPCAPVRRRQIPLFRAKGRTARPGPQSTRGVPRAWPDPHNKRWPQASPRSTSHAGRPARSHANNGGRRPEAVTARAVAVSARSPEGDLGALGLELVLGLVRGLLVDLLEDRPSARPRRGPWPPSGPGRSARARP